MASVHDIEVRDLPIERVVVLTDRAEVKRNTKLHLQAGFNEIRLKNLSRSYVNDSLRIEGRGSATIHDVQIKSNPSAHEETDSPKLAELRREFHEKEAARNVFEDQRQVLEKRIAALDKLIEQIGTGLFPKEGGDVPLTKVVDVYAFYDNSAVELRGNLRKVQIDLQKADEALNVARNKLDQQQGFDNENRFSQWAIVTLEAAEESEVELNLTYQVYSASWYPTYDIRADIGAENSLKITYYGIINQNTNEDWTEVPLVLSTAKPNVGGSLPELDTVEASFYRPPPPPVHIENQREYAPRTCMMKAVAYDSAPLGRIAHAQVARIENNSLTTEYSISRPATIAHGTSDHKITIGIATLQPQLVYETVPSLNTSVFLTASAVNSSDFVLLAGTTSIYLNNAFVSNGTLKEVSPGERFTCSLGVDSAIKVDYKPAKKYHEQTGLINKSSSQVTEQVISVKNSRSDNSLLLTIKENIPRSTDEKIKIRLVSPNAAPYDEATFAKAEGEAPKEGARINAANNLEWTIKLQGGQTQNLSVKYIVDHPSNEKLVFNHV